MVFTEPIFLFFFLPFVLIAYFASGRVFQNSILLTASLAFYTWGEELYVLVLLASILLNYFAGLMIGRASGKSRVLWLWAGIMGNLSLLGYFKYTGFTLNIFGVENASSIAPALPIGISFFTFQALSYLIDLYYQRLTVQRSPFRLALYISLFPQLIAGPIVRYSEVEDALGNRKSERSDVSAGIHRFVIGLAKKTLLADPLGLVADQIFGIPSDGLSPAVAWLGVLAYSLQLYFDFSAYSDMAIGLGRIFGFKFPENFNYPYAARSVTEFWRRWHMTLSRWFRDYLYIPLGGNRQGAGRTYFNLWLVFLATGLWHGAAWTFIFWGAYHGTFLILERIGGAQVLVRLPSIVRRMYLIVVVMLGWTAFRSEGFDQLSTFYGAMLLGQSGELAQFYSIGRYLDAYMATILVLAIVLAFPVVNIFYTTSMDAVSPSLQRRLYAIMYWVIFGVTVISVGAASYSPFIYFRF